MISDGGKLLTLEIALIAFIKFINQSIWVLCEFSCLTTVVKLKFLLTEVAEVWGENIFNFNKNEQRNSFSLPFYFSFSFQKNFQPISFLSRLISSFHAQSLSNMIELWEEQRHNSKEKVQVVPKQQRATIHKQRFRQNLLHEHRKIFCFPLLCYPFQKYSLWLIQAKKQTRQICCRHNSAHILSTKFCCLMFGSFQFRKSKLELSSLQSIEYPVPRLLSICSLSYCLRWKVCWSLCWLWLKENISILSLNRRKL